MNNFRQSFPSKRSANRTAKVLNSRICGHSKAPPPQQSAHYERGWASSPIRTVLWVSMHWGEGSAVWWTKTQPRRGWLKCLSGCAVGQELSWPKDLSRGWSPKRTAFLVHGAASVTSFCRLFYAFPGAIITWIPVLGSLCNSSSRVNARFFFNYLGPPITISNKHAKRFLLIWLLMCVPKKQPKCRYGF